MTSTVVPMAPALTGRRVYSGRSCPHDVHRLYEVARHPDALNR